MTAITRSLIFREVILESRSENISFLIIAKQALITDFETEEKTGPLIANEILLLNQKPTVVLDLSDTSTDNSIFDPVRNKRARLLSKSDEKLLVVLFLISV
ncbi:hypothetical protein TNCV_3520881 [Trichonephila clavipes]|nr:hypothetical protein TNCV_3520881 [Trichonephila clavipes]